MSWVWLNGRLVEEEAARIGVHDRGFTLGDGLFETMRAYNGRAFRLRAHLDRLAAAAARIGIPLPTDLEGAIRGTLTANDLDDAAVRVTVSRGPGVGVTPPESVVPTVVVSAAPYRPDEQWYEHGVRAVVASGRLNEHAPAAGLKRLGYLDAIVALAEARAAGVEEVILLDTAGHLAEGAVSNLFLVLDGALHTPPLSCGVLPGITRATVLELARASGIETLERPLPPDALARASEAFLTNSLRELVPLVAVDGRPIGGGRPGPLTLHLLDRYRELVHVETAGST